MGDETPLKRVGMSVDNTDGEQSERRAMSDNRDAGYGWGFDIDAWPHEPPPELLEALDRAAARLSELDARGVQIALGIGSDGGARARLSHGSQIVDIHPSQLLRLVCESPPEPMRV